MDLDPVVPARERESIAETRLSAKKASVMILLATWLILSGFVGDIAERSERRPVLRRFWQ